MKANDGKMNNLEIEFDHFQKQCEQMQDDLLNQTRDFMQNFHDGLLIPPPGEDKEHEATTDMELSSTKDIQPLPMQKMEDTMFELVKIFQEKEFLCIHDDIDDLIKSALDSKLLLINSNSQRLEKKQQEVNNVVEQPAEREKCSIQSLQNIRIVHKSSISFRDTYQISSIHSIAPILSTKEPENSLSMGYEHLSITPDKKEQEVKIVEEQPAERRNLAPILSTKEPEHLLSMGYEHLNITPEMEFDEVTESNAKNLLPIPNECEVALEDKRECDLLISENSSVCDNSDTFSDSEINDDISVYDDEFEDIDYIEASLLDPDIVSIEEENGVEEENVVQQKEEEVDLEDISQIQDVVLREKLFSITRLISNIESLKDNSTPDRMLISFESDNSLLDNFSSEFETFCDHSEETRSEEVDLFLSDDSIPPGIENVADDPEGDVRFLEELLIDDSILSHELSDDNFEDNPLISRPPPEPLDVESFFDLKPDMIAEEISDKLNKDKCFDPRREINVS
nr:hypothetical protein [Tanacetum cinerariifolium]